MILVCGCWPGRYEGHLARLERLHAELAVRAPKPVRVRARTRTQPRPRPRTHAHAPRTQSPHWLAASLRSRARTFVLPPSRAFTPPSHLLPLPTLPPLSPSCQSGARPGIRKALVDCNVLGVLQQVRADIYDIMHT